MCIHIDFCIDSRTGLGFIMANLDSWSLSDLMFCLLFSVCKVDVEPIIYDDLAGNLELTWPKHLVNLFWQCLKVIHINPDLHNASSLLQKMCVCSVSVLQFCSAGCCHIFTRWFLQAQFAITASVSTLWLLISL